MNKLILSFGLVALLISCKQTKKENPLALSEVNKGVTSLVNQQPNEGYTLMKNTCYACHNPNTASHDDILAPPFKAVKMRYTRQYNNKVDFVNAMVNWVQNPEDDKALMRGAVKQFKLMPKLPLPTEDLKKIAIYIYENEVEEPEWMEAHMKETHGGKNGNGNGMMKGKN